MSIVSLSKNISRDQVVPGLQCGLICKIYFLSVVSLCEEDIVWLYLTMEKGFHT